MTPPLGDDRFGHLWGFYSPAEACAATVEFDVSIDTRAQPAAFGIAVAPRAGSDADQITGSSIQYEWEDAADFGVQGSFARPVELPGGAWRASTDPVRMPDVHARHHVIVRAIGTSMTIDVDGTSAGFDAPGVECGGVGLRAWGAPVEFSHVNVRST